MKRVQIFLFILKLILNHEIDDIDNHHPVVHQIGEGILNK